MTNAARAVRPRRLLRTALLLSTALTATAFAAAPAMAQIATWKTNANTSWFIDSNNWTPAEVPTNTGSFGQSSISSIIADSSVGIGTIQFNSDARAYNFNIYGGSTFSLSGNGIVNYGSAAQNFQVQNATLRFHNSASAGDSLITYALNSSLGVIEFTGNSTAGSANFTTTYSGQLVFKDSASGGTASYTADNYTVLDITGLTTSGTTIGSIAGGGTILLGGKTLTVGGNNASTTYSGVISGSSGGLVKVGTGTLTLTGANTYLAGTTVNGGTLRLGASNVLGFNRPVVVNSGGTLDLNNFNTTLGQVTGDGSVTLGSGTLTLIALGGTFSGVISGSGGLNVGGGAGATYTLSGTNTYSGGTAVNSNTILSVSSDANLGNVNGGLNLNNGTLAFGSSFNLASTRAVTIGSSGGTIDVGGNNATISGAISGSGGLTKRGAGTLTLSGTNDFAGLTIVGNNVVSYVAVSADNQLGTAGASVTANTLGFLKATSSFSSSRLFALTQGYAGFSVDAGATLTWDGVIAGTPASGGLSVRGPGTLVLTGTNTYVGGTAIATGTTVQISSDANLGNGSNAISFYSGTLAVTSDMSTGRSIALESGFNGTISVSSGKTLTYSGGISGDASSRFIKAGDGTLVLTGANSYTGGTTVSGGTLVGTTNTLKGDIVNNGIVQFNVNLSSTYSGNMSGTGALVVTGAVGGQTLVLTGTNTYSGGTTVTGSPSVTVSSDAALGSATGGITLSNQGTLRFGASFNLASTRAISMGTNGGRIDTNGFDTTISQSITGAGYLAKYGAGTLTFTAANTFSSLGIHGGVVVVSANNQLGAGTSAVSINTGGTLRTASSFVVNRFLGVYSGASVLDVTNAAATLNWASQIYGTGALAKAGAGTLVLHAGNTFSGGTIISGGTLAINGDSALGAANGGLTFDGGTLQFLAGFDVGSARAITLNASGGTVDTNGFSSGILGPIGGSGGLTKIGAGTLTLSGTNTYTGGTFLNAGTLAISADGNLGDAAGRVTFNGGTLQFAASTTLANTRPMTLNADGVIDTNGFDAGIAGSIGGMGGLVKNGTGTLFLAAGNTYIGGTTINGGAISISASTALGHASSVITFNGGSLLTPVDISLNQNIVLDGNGTIVNNAITRLNGVVSGSGDLIKSGSGVLGLIAANTFTGRLVVNQSVVVLQDGVPLGNIAVASGASVNFQDYTFGRNSTYAGVISGAGRISQTGRGTLTLSGTNTYSGGTIIGGTDNSAILAVSSDANLGDSSGYIYFSGGRLKFLSNFDLASTRTVNINNFGGTFALNGATTTFGGVIENAGRLTIEGPGTMTFTGANTYGGGTTVRDGAALAIGSDARLGTGDLALDGGTLRYLATFDLSNTRPVTLNAGGGTFDTNGFDTTISQVIGGAGGLTKAGAGTLTLTGLNTYLGPTAVSGGTLVGSTDNLRGDIVNNGAVVFDQGFTSDTYAGVMSGSGSLTKNGLGVLILTGANTYSGGTTLNNGTLRVSSDANFGAATGTLTLAGGRMEFDSTFDLATTRNIVVTGGGGTLILNGNTVTVAGSVSGAAVLSMLGSGKLILSGTNSFGTADIRGTGATLAVSSSASLSPSTLRLSQGGTLQFLSSFNASSVVGLALTFGDGIVDTNGHDATLASGAYGSGRLVKAGGGTLTLSGNNTHTGGTLLSGGTLAVSSDANLGGGAGGLSFDGGTLKTLGSVTSGRAVTLNAGGGAIDTNGFNSTFNGVIDGSGHLTTTGAGKLSLTGTNTYSGGTVISGGSTLAIGSDAVLGDVNGGVTFDNGTLQFLNSFNLANTRALTLNAGGGTIDTNTHDITISQAIGGAGGLTKSGAGTLLLSANNSYSGGTTINGGTLRIGSNTALGSGSGGITFNGGTLQYDSSISNMNRAVVLNGSGTIKGEAILQLQGAISGSGDLIKEGTMGVLSLTGPLTYTGRTIINGGLVSFGTPAPQGDIIINDGEVAFGGSTASTYGGVISGAGSMSHSGADLTLTGTNTYAGGTRLEAGTIAVSREANLGAATGGLNFSGGTLKFLSSFDLSSTRNINLSFTGGTFQLNGATTTVAGRIAGTAPLTITGPGTMTLTFANTYTGGTILSGGATLAVGNDAALGGVNSGVTFNNGTLQFLNTFNLANTRPLTLNAGGGTIDTNGFNTEIWQAIGGSGGLTKSGAGTLILRGANSYTGATSINGGTLAISASTTLANSSGLTINGGTLRVTNVASLNQPVTLTGAATFNVVTIFDGLSLSGNVGGTGSLIKTGAGSLTLRGTADYTGGTTVSGGSLVGSTDNLKGNITNNAIVYFGQDSDGTYAGIMSGTGMLSKFGSATLTLTGLNTHQGGTQVTAGTLAVGQDANLGSATGDISLRNGGILRFLSSFDLSSGRDVELVTSGRLQLVSSTNRIAGTIHGTGNLAIEGPGTLSLTGTNTFTGTTSVTGSTLEISGDASLGDTANALTLDNSTLRFLSNSTLAGTRAITLGTGSAIDTNGYDATIASAISGSSGLTQSGAGKLSLTGANTFSGAIAISGGGTLAIGSDAALGNVNNGVTFDNGTLQFLNSFNLASTRTLTLDAGGGAIDTNGFNTTISQAITGSGPLTKTGAGTLTLSGTNTYVGGTTISGGTVSIGADDALGNVTSGITLNGGTLQTTSDINMNRAIVLSANSTIVNDGILGLFGAISGSGDLSKWGSSILVLAGNNTHTGRLIVNQGAVSIVSGSAPIGDIVVNNGTSVYFSTFYPDDATYSGAISGTGSVVQTGDGTLTLTGINTHTGGTIIGAGHSGTLAVASDANLGNASGLISFQGGRLKFLSSFDLASTRTVSVTSFGGTFSLNGATTTFGGVIDDVGRLTIEGPGTMTFTGANTYSGGTAVRGGAALAIGSDARLGTGSLALDGGTLRYLATFDLANTRPITLGGGGGTFDTNGFDTTITQAIGGTGGLTKSGAGTLTLTGANSYTGETTISGGVLAISASSPFGNSSGLTINGGTLRVTNVVTLNHPVTLSGAATFDVVTNADDLSLSGHLGGSGSLIKTGAGSLTLLGTANYAGGTTVSAGSLIGSAANLRGDITNNGLVSFGQVSSDGVYAGVMSGTGTLSKSGEGTLTLTGLNTYEGGTHVTAGFLAVALDANLGSATSDIRLATGGGLRFLSSFDLSAGRDIELVTSGRISLASSTNTIAGTIHGTGDLAINGLGTLTLAGANTFTGAVSVAGSTLAVAADANLGNTGNSLTLHGGGLRFLSSFDLAGTRALTLNAGGGTIDTNGFSTTISQAIGGTGGLTKAGAGTLSLTGANTYEGNTVISGGTLAIASDAALGDVNGGVAFDNGTLQFLNSFNLASTRALTLNAGGGTIDTNGNDTTIAQAIGGAGGLTKAGSGTLILSGANTYSGGTTVSGGTLQLGAGGSLLSTGALTMTGGTFDLNGQNQVVGNLSGTGGSLLLSNGTFLQVGQTTNTTFGGTIDGGGQLVKAGNGTLTLSGSNTHTGGTAIGSGTLSVSSDAALGAASGVLAIQGGFLRTTASFSMARTTTLLNGGGFEVDNGVTLTHSGTISGLDYLVKQGAGTLVLEGTNTYTAETVIGQGTLKVTNSAALGAASANLRIQGGTLLTDSDLVLTHDVQSNGNGNAIRVDAGTTTLQGAFSGWGTLTKSGAGTLKLVGTSSYSGTTTVLAGILQGDTSTLRGTISNQAQVVFDQDTDGSFTGVINNVGSVTKRGSGVVTFDANQSYEGGTTIAGGTLRLGTGVSLSSLASLTVDAGTFDLNGNNQTVGALAGSGGMVALGSGTLTVDQSTTTSFAGEITGSGAFVKNGSGMLTLTGANTYSGGTTVNGGILRGTTASLQGDIVTNAAVYFFQATTGTYAGAMSGSGSMLVTGGGKVILTGNSTYSGGTTVGAGNVLQLGNGGTTGWIAGDVVTNGTLAFNRSDDVVFAGNISGIGGISLMGPGVVTLTGNNTFLGDITVGGTIRAGSDSELGPIGNILRLAGGTVQATASFTSTRPFELTSGTGTFDTNGNDLTLSGVVSGSGALAKAGTGTLILAGANTYTGGTNVLAGILQLGAGGSLLAGSVLNILGGTFDLNGANQTVGALSGLNGAITLGSGTLTVDQTTDTAVGAAISGSGSLVKTGSGTLTLIGTNSYTGGTTVSAGTLAGSTDGLQGDILNDAAVVFDQTTDGTYAGIMSGSGTLTKTGSGNVTLSGANTYGGGTTVSAGTLTGTSTSLQGAIVNNSLVTFDQSFDGTYAGVMSGTGLLTKVGTGNLTLSGANTYNGGTTVAAGTLTGTMTSLQGAILNNAAVVFDQAFDGTYAGAMSGSGSLTKSGGGNLTLSGTNTYSGGTTISDGTLTGTTTSLQGNIANSGALFFDQATAGTYAGILSGSGNLIVANGDVTFSGVNTYSGTTTVQSGATLRLGTGGSLGATRLLDVNATGTFDLAGRTQTVGGLTGAGSVLLGTGGALTVDQATNQTFAGVISGDGSLIKSGGGTLVLTGANTYTGGTVVNAGVLQMGATNTMPLFRPLTVNGGTFDLNGYNQMVGTLSGSGGTIDLGTATLTLIQRGEAVYNGAIVGTGALDVQGQGSQLTLTGANTYSGGTTLDSVWFIGTTDSLQGNIAASASALVIFDQGTSGTYAGVISGNGGLVKKSGGTVVLTGANTYTGGTNVYGGILQLGAGGSLSASGSLHVNGGTFDLNGASQTVSELRGDYGTITLGSGTLTVNQTTDTSTGVDVSGSGSLIKTGSGRLTLTNTNSYTGGTTVSGGTLQIGFDNILAATGALTVTGGTFDLNGFDQTVSALAGAGGTVALGTGSVLTVNQSSSTSFAGAIGGNGSLVKTGSGTLTLIGTNTYSGGTTVSGGTLIGTASSLQGNIVNNAAVVFDQLLFETYAGNMSGSGTLTKTGSGTLILSGTNSYSGGTTVSGGMLAGTTASLQGAILNNAFVSFDQDTDGTYAAVMSGSGALIKAGLGMLTLTGANSYGGGTFISGGTLSVANNAALGAASGGLSFDGGTLQTTASFAMARATILENGGGRFNVDNGTTLTQDGDITGAGRLTKQGGGTLILGGTNSYSGGTTVSGGTLIGTTTSLQGNILNNAAIVFDQSTDGIYAGVMSGGTGGSLTKSGAGNLTLTGANTYRGGTTVSGGTLTGTTTSLQGNIVNNAAVVFDQAVDGTYAGNMSGSGALTKIGNGNLTLSGTSSYSGGTTVSVGTLTGTTSSLQGTIVNNSIVVFNQNTIGTYAGDLSGSGALTVSGGGAVLLTGTVSHTGGTTIAANTILQIGNGGTTGSLAGNVVTNGTLSFYRSDDIVFAGNISGSGGVTLMGSGSVTLTGTNTYTGATTVGGGVIIASSDANLGPTGNLLILNGGAVQTIASFSTARPIELGASGGTFDTNGYTLTLAGTVSGDGRLTKSGAGTLILTGTNTYSGGTTVNGGILQGTTDSLQGDITNNAVVAFNQITAGTYGGAISGAGAVTIDGAITFTGTNTYTAGTTISTGSSLTLSGSGSIQGNVTNGGILQFAGTGTTAGGAISGSGAVQQVSGTTVLTAANSYTGGTTISGGTLQLGAGGSLASSGAMTVNGGTFDLNGNAQTIAALSGTGGAVALGDGGVLTVTQSGNTSYAGIIGGNGSLVMNGSGTFTLTLAGANTHANTVVNGGVLQLGAGGSLAATSTLTVNGGTFDFNGNTQTIGGLAGTGGTVALGNGALTVDQAGNTSYAGTIDGTGSLTKAGSGTLVLAGVNSYTGGTTVSGGTLQMGINGALAAGSALTVNGGTFDLNGYNQTVGTLSGTGGAVALGSGTLTVDQSSNMTYAGSIGGAGTLIKAGNGTLILSGTNSLTNTVVSGGVLQGTTASLQGGIVNNAGVVFNQSTTGTYAGTMSGTGSVTVSGGGIVVVTGTNTYSGDTTIATGSTLQLGVGGTTGMIAGSVAVDGTLTFYRSDNIVFAGDISGSGGIKLMGTGSVDFTGTNTFTGGVSVGGILRAGSDSQLGPAGSTLTLDDGTVQATASFSSGRQIVLAGSAGTFDTNGFTLTLTGVLSGSGNLIKTGTGTLVLDGTASYTGDTFVSGGTLQGTMAALSRNITNNATVTFSDSGVYGGIMSGTGALLVASGTTIGFSGANTYTGGTIVQTGGTLDLGTGSIAGDVENEGLVRFVNNSPMSFGGSIAGSGSLLVDGSLVLTGANSYTGTTQIEAGLLQLGLGGSLSSSTLLNLGNNGGTFDLNGQTQTVSGIAGDGSTNILLGSGALTVDQATNGSFGGQISGSGSLIKAGVGTLALTGSNTHASTIVNGGTLQLGAGGSLAATSALAVNGGTFDLNGQNQTVGALSGTGGTVGLNGSAALTVNQSTDTNYAGAFTGNGSLIKDGGGTLSLTGASSHSGGTVINNGTLQLGTGGNLTATGAVAVNGGTFDLNGQTQTVGSLSGTGGTVALSNNGALTVNQSTDTSYAGTIAGTGSLTKSGDGTLTLTGTNSYTGGTTVSGGTLAGTTSSLQGNIVNNANVTFDQVGAGVYAGAMSGTGTLTKSGVGTVVLTGENTFTGGTIIAGGILQIGNGGTTGSLAGNVQNDGTLAFFRSDNITFGGNISGTGGLLFMGNATVTLTGNNTFTGGIAMGGGTLVVGADSELGGAGSTLTLAGSTVQATASFTSNRSIVLSTGGGTFNTGSNVLTLAGVVSGVGGLVVGEGSSVVLTGANTYSGGTTISTGALLSLGGSGSIQGDVANSGTLQFAGTGTTFGGSISGSGTVQQVSGTTVLTGNSLHTGGTTISGGTLQLGIDNALTTTGSLAINGGTFDLNGNAQTIGALSGTGGGVTLNGGTLTVNQTGDTTYAGIVSGAGSFIKDGSGTLILTGANTNANTIVNGGILQGTTASLQGNIANNATVVFEQTATGTYAGNMSGNGGMTKSGGGALILSGDNSGYTGTTTVAAGLLQIGDGVGGTAMAGNIVNNAAVAFMAGGAGLSYGGSISGSGGVSVAGTAQTTFTGMHSYTGGTTVTSTAGLNIGSSTTTAKIVGALIADGGFANFVNADMSGMGSITARNGGLLGFSSSASAAATALLVADAASALAFSDASTAGTSTITNSGNVRFTGNSSGGTARYIGSGGDLSIAGIAGSSTTIGSIEGSGTVSLGSKQLAVGGNNQSTQFSGVIGGAGSLLKQGTGTLTLTGNNTYSGGTTVTGGLVNFTTLGNFGTGNVTLNGGGVQWAAGTTTDISARLAAFGVNGGTLDTNGNNVTLANGISGTGSLTKAGNGVLTLAGNNTYTGGTFVTGGSIALTGSIAGPVGVSGGLFSANGTIGGTVTVSGTGTLSGTGTVGGIAMTGGTVAPGNSIGTLNVAGNYVQSGGIYQVEVNSAGQADRINVTGTATLSGGTVQVVADQTGTYARNTSYTILTATGGITGTYSNATSNLAFLTPTLSYSSTSVTLMLEMLQSAFRNAAQTPNQAAVGAALDAAAPTATGDFANVINALSVLNTQQGPAALTAISGQNYSALSSASVQSAQLFMSNFANQASGATRGGSTAQAAGATSRVQLAEACSVACDTTATGTWGAWGGAIGGFGTIGGNSNSSTVTYNLGGFAGGIDRQVTEELLVGFTLGYSSGTQWTSGFAGRSTSNTYQAGLYGSFLKGPVYVDGLVGYAYSDNQMLRQIQIPGLNSRVATGQTGTNQFFGQIEAGYRIDLGTTANAYLTPWARLQGSTATQNGLTESGADSLNLIVASQTTNSLRSVLGVTLGGEMDIGSGNKLAGQFKVGWAHEFANTDRPVTASFLGAPALPFTTYGAAPQRDGVILGINATANLGERTNLFLRYEGEFQGIDNSHAFSAGIRFTW
ncbi:autotransporter-associated beta strand repeat-containing protein [Reyranella sp.]|uniref:autotransporter-associated beta strand repeat-containing protein n=1 Tax=Reyranella sp. TaxID=1929291 RepID=UPI0025DD45B3|nr:autotransporter-associated beta strand repeat-containing protein [Reyranella sp.]